MPQIEVLPNAKQNLAPGWAYVPDTGYDPSRAPLNPSAPRRLRASTTNNITGVGYGGESGSGAVGAGAAGAAAVVDAAVNGSGLGLGLGLGGGGYDDVMDIDGVGVGGVGGGGGKKGKRGDGADFGGLGGGAGGVVGGMGGRGGAGLNARQRGVVLKRLAEMDKDGGGKDVALPREYTVAGGAGAGAGAGAGSRNVSSAGAKGMLGCFSSCWEDERREKDNP